GDQESRRRASDPGLTAAPRRAPRAAPEAAAGSGGGAAARADAEPELPRFGPPEQQPTPARGDGAGGPVASRAPPSFSFGPAASGGPGEDGETGPRGPLARGLPDAAASSIPTTPDFGGWPQQQSGDRPPLQRYKTWPGRTSALEHDRTDSGEPDKEPDEGAAGSLQPAAGSSWSDLRLGGASSVAPRFGLDSPELAEGLEDDSDGSQGPMAQPVWSLGAGGEQRGAGDSPPPDAAVHSPWLHVGPPEPAEDYVRLEAEIESVRHRAVVAALEAEIERLGHSCGELRAELRGRTGLLEGCEQELQTARSELRERRDWQSPQQLWRVVDTREQRAVAAEKEALVLRAELREATLAPRAAAPSAPLSPELQEPACEPPSCEGLPGLEQPGAWWDHCVGLQEEARGELEDIAQHVRDASAELAASRAECADASARHEESAADLHFRLVGSYGRHSDAEAAAQAAQARLEEELVEVREECQAIETALRDELSAAREQRQAVEAALRADLAEASATLRGELLAAREQQLAVEAALRADLAEASGALRGELSAAREQQLAVEVALRSDLAEASEQHRTELGVLREELADASKELRAAEAALPRLLSDASQQRHATEADLQELRLELAVAGEGRQAAEEAQECELAEAHRRHGVAEAVLRGELAEAREQHKQLSTAAAAGRAAAAHQQTELAAARRALTAARSEVEEACQREESVGDLLATLATTRRQLSRARAAEFGAAAESRVGLQEAKGALEAARFGESRLEEDLATALAQRRDALAASESAQRASWGLGRDLAEASEELGRERSALWAARSGLGLSEARLAELEQELGSERVALRDTRADLSRSEAAAAEARTELGRASAALEASRADREECRVLLVAAGEEREEMGRALHATQASLLGSEQISEEMGRSLQVLSEAREELQAAQVRSDDEARGELDHEGAALQVARAELHEAMAQLRNAGNAAVRDVLLAAQQAEEERDVLSTECEEAASRARRAEQQLEETNGRLEQTTLELLAELEAERLASARGAQAALEERAVAAVSAAAAEASAAECARLRAEMASERGRLTEEATTEAEAVQQVRDVLLISTECEEAASRSRRAEQQLEETNGRLEQTTLELLAELEAERLASARGAQAALDERAVAAVSAAAAEASAEECARLHAEVALERGRLTEEATTEAEAVQQVRGALVKAQQTERERKVLRAECEEAASRARRAEQQLEETNGRLEQTTLELLAELEAERLASARGAQAALEERAVAAVSAAAAEASAEECARLHAEVALERGRLTDEVSAEAEAVKQVERYAGKAMEAASEVCERRVAAAEAAARDAGRRSAAAEAAAAAQRARAAAEMAQLSRRLESELGAYRDEGRAQRHRAEQLQQEARGAAAAELAEACSLGELRASLEQERLEVEQLRREARQAREAEAEAQAQLRRQVGEAREAHQAREARAALEAEAREAHAAEAAGQPRREAREAREARGARDAEAEAVAQLRREAREAREAVAEARLEADRLQREARGQLEARAAREAQHTARARGASEAGEAPEAGAAAREAREAEAEAEGPLGREARATREVGPRDGRGEEGRSDESAGPAGSSPGGLDVDQLSARGKHCDSYGERTCADDEVLDLMGANDIPSEEFGKWTSKGTGTYLEGGMEAGSMLVNQRFCPRTVGGRTWTPFGTGSICTSRGPGDPEFASPPSVVLALGLASEPIRPGFLLASREGSPASAAKGIADGFGCSCAGLPECLPGCCAEGAPSACLADVPTKEDLVGADEHGNLLGIRALKIGGRELYTASRRIELPVRTNQILLQIPAQLRLIHPVVTCLVGGMLSFGAVFTELFFIMSSMWQHQFYSFFGLFALSGCGGLADPAPASAGPCPSSNSSEFQQTAGGERLPINGYAPEVAGFKQFWRMGDQAKVLTCFASLCNGVDVTVAGYLRRLNQERGELFDVFGAMLGMLRAGSPMILCAGVFFEVSLGNQGEIGAGAVSVRVAADQLVDVFIQLAGGFAVFHEQCEVAGGIAEGQWQAEGAGGIAEGLLV
ncbi:unnamed protein product, partial [Prorocentrum cordatum]